MSITKVDQDPSDGVKVLYLEKKITHKNEEDKPLPALSKTYSLYLGENIHARIPALFNKMQYLIRSGYHGVSLNKKTQSLIWQKQDTQKTNILNFSNLLQQKKVSSF